MVYFQNKNPNLGKFWRSLEWKRLEYSMVIWNIFRPFGILPIRSFGDLVANWYVFHHFGILCQEKSGNPADLQRDVDDVLLLVGGDVTVRHVEADPGKA
jgi:hypothetical protein